MDGGERPPPPIQKGKGSGLFKKTRRFFGLLSHTKTALLRGVEVVYKFLDHALYLPYLSYQKNPIHQASKEDPFKNAPLAPSLVRSELRGVNPRNFGGSGGFISEHLRTLGSGPPGSPESLWFRLWTPRISGPTESGTPGTPELWGTLDLWSTLLSEGNGWILWGAI